VDYYRLSRSCYIYTGMIDPALIFVEDFHV